MIMEQLDKSITLLLYSNHTHCNLKSNCQIANKCNLLPQNEHKVTNLYTEIQPVKHVTEQYKTKSTQNIDFCQTNKELYPRIIYYINWSLHYEQFESVITLTSSWCYYISAHFVIAGHKCAHMHDQNNAKKCFCFFVFF